MQTSALDDDANVVDDMKGRRLHNVLEQIRSRDQRDVGNKGSVLDELHSFANTVNGLELPPASASSLHHDQHQLSYSDRLAQTRSDLKLLEQLVGQTFHWLPQQPPVYDSTGSDVTDQQHPVMILSHYFYLSPLGYIHECKT